MIAFRPVLFLDGILLLALALAMLIPAIAGGFSGDGAVFAGCALGTLFFAGVLILGARPAHSFRLDLRQSFMLVVTGILLTALCAAFPLRFASSSLSFADAWFEAVSGLTTTGATVMRGLDQTSHVVLLWRALLNWLGGIGIIMMGMVLMPTMKIGGLQLFQRDVAEGRAGLRRKISKAGLWVLLGYAGFTLASAIGFWGAGMTPFDAMCHALAAISTGGFSTSDWSLRHWGAGVHWVAIVTMIVGASPLPLVLFYRQRFASHPLFDQQFKAYLFILVAFSSFQALWLWDNGASLDLDWARLSIFSAVTIITTTGFAIADSTVWGGFAHLAFFLMAFLGGCTGSASGAIKVFRWQIMTAKVLGLVRKVVYPHRVIPVSFNGTVVSADVMESVYAFVAAYLMTFIAFAIVLAGLGLDLLSALTASASALGNVGRAIGDIFGSTGSWAALPRSVKWLLSAEMIMGRFEIFAVLILFTPAYWKE